MAKVDRETAVRLYAAEKRKREKPVQLEVSAALHEALRRACRAGESIEDVAWRLLRSMGDKDDPRAAEVFEFLESETFIVATELTERYLALLGFLYEQNPTRFLRKVLSIRKRQRVYFARTRKAVADSGASTQPRPIPNSNSPLWALTLMRADRKIEVIGRVLAALDYGEDVRRSVEHAMLSGVRRRVRE